MKSKLHPLNYFAATLTYVRATYTTKLDATIKDTSNVHVLMQLTWVTMIRGYTNELVYSEPHIW